MRGTWRAAGSLAAVAFQLGLAGAALAAPIGKAQSVVPASSYVRAGAVNALAINAALEQNDAIRTSGSGSTLVRFVDDTMLTIGPNANIVLDEGVFNGSQAQKLSVRVVSGAMRFVSGLSNRDAYEIKTPIANIGIRGTVLDLSVVFNPTNPALSRIISNFVDGAGTICLNGNSQCRDVVPGGPPLVITAAGFSIASPAEAAALFKLLDRAHFSLAQASGANPAAPMGAAAGGTQTTTNNFGGTVLTNLLPPPPTDHIILQTSPLSQLTTGVPFPSSFQVFNVAGSSGFDVGFKSNVYSQRASLVFDPGTDQLRSATIAGTPDPNDPFTVTITRGTAQISDVFIGTANVPGEGTVPIYYMSSLGNGTVTLTPSVGSPLTLALGPNQLFSTMFWGYSGNLFDTPLNFGTTVLFNLEAATRPAWTNGQSPPGTFTGQMAVGIGPTSLSYGVVGTVSMQEGVFNFSTAGGVADPSQSSLKSPLTVQGVQTVVSGFNGIATTGPASVCGSGCVTELELSIVYLGKIGLAYQISQGSNPGTGPEISGLATFSQSASPPTPASGLGTVVVGAGSINSNQLEFVQSGTLTQQAGALVLQSLGNGQKGTAVSTDLFSVAGLIGHERWTNGTLTLNGSTYVIPPNGGVHFVYGAPASNLPSGGIAVQYSLVSATSPTLFDGSVGPGSVGTNSKIAIDFQTFKVGVDMYVTIGSSPGTYNFSTIGGVSTPYASQISLTQVGTDYRFSGSALPVTLMSGVGIADCTTGTCTAQVAGFLSGAGGPNNLGSIGTGGQYVGLDYQFGNAPANVVTGAAIFGRDFPASDIGALAFSTGGSNFGLSGTATLNTIGSTTAQGLALNYLQVGGDQFLQINRTTVGNTEQGGVSGILGWERWSSASGGYGAPGGGSAFSVGANQGIHMVHGVSATNVPTSGTYTYNLVGGTSPTIADGSVAPGSFVGSNKIGIAFGGIPKIGVDLNVSIGGGSYNILSSGGAGAPSISAATLASSGLFNLSNIATSLTSGSNVVCPTGGCSANINGFIAGNGASHAGAVIQFGNFATNPSTVVTAAGGFAR